MHDPDDQILPPEVRSRELEGLEGLARRESAAIPSHYALSLADLRAGQPQRVAPVEPAPVESVAPVEPAPVEPAPVEPLTLVDGEWSDVASLFDLLPRISATLRRVADGGDRAALESLALRVDSIERGDPVLALIRLRRRSRVAYAAIAAELNERAKAEPRYATPSGVAWTPPRCRGVHAKWKTAQ